MASSRALSGRRSLIVALTTAGLALAGGGVASAGNGGASGGGIAAPKPPKVTEVSCIEQCRGLQEVTVDGTIELSGKRLKYTHKVKFPTQDGGKLVNPTEVKGRSVQAKVPEGAKDGKPRVVDEFGQIAKAPDPLDIIPESALPEPGSFSLLDASVSPQKAFFYGESKPTLHYVFKGNGPTDIRIDLVKQNSDEVVRSWVEEGVEPNVEQTLEWDGLGDDSKAAKKGTYEFRLGGVGDSLSRGEGGTTEFGYYDHKFPLRGKHSYGDGIGAGRGHQGQDVFGKCGNTIEAARGGKVQFKGYQGSGAGNYVVIDGKKSRFDYVYMHLRQKAEVKEGERVRTGERIGENGDTGNASGCHLHFEMWTPPGWYEGGSFISPTKKLKTWDKWS